MINGLEGIPGSGKSYEAVAMHVLPALRAGRMVITNLPLLAASFSALDESYAALIQLRTKTQPVLGKWDAEAVDDAGNGHAFSLIDGDFEKPLNVPVFGSVWDYYSPWKHPSTGSGPLYIIDEAHLALPVIRCDQQVIEWFKLHRHFNADVLLATQSFRDLNQPVARLVAMLIKCRKADILGKKDCYIRKVHAGYRGAVISTEERKYNPAFFALYRSHSQGNSVAESAASDVQPFLVKFKRFSRVFYLLTAAYCVFAFWRWYSPPKASIAASSVVSAFVPLAPSAGIVPAVVQPVPGASAAKSSQAVVMLPGEVPEPYATKELHLTGLIRMGRRVVYVFAVMLGPARFSTVTSEDLVRVGYIWDPMTDCAGTLRWKNQARPVTCDSPEVPTGSRNDPVVLGLPAGAAEPSARSDAYRRS